MLRLRPPGVKVKPRYAAGRDDVVAGYSSRSDLPRGKPVAWFGGGRLARELSLPRLRESWPDTSGSASDAVAEWSAAARGQRPVAPGPERHEVDPATQVEMARELQALRQRMRWVPVDDQAAWGHVAHETAGAFAAWSMQVEAVRGRWRRRPWHSR